MSKKTNTLICICLLLGFMLANTASMCSEDEDSKSSSTNSTSNTTTKQTKPSISILSYASTTADIVVNFKVSVGKVADYNTQVTMYYGTSKDNLSKSRKCVYQRSEGKTTIYQYYKGQATGFNGGTRIYFKGVVSNAGGTAETSVGSVMIKR